MWKPLVATLATAAMFSPGVAQTAGASAGAQFDKGMETMWEVLWHQSGTPTRLVRWDQDLKVRVFGVNLDRHRENTLQALREVAAEAGVKVIDVSDRADAVNAANVSIEILPNDRLSENQPCETRLDFRTETTIDSVTVQMRDSDAWRCAHHESMHVMGVRGHPEGDTVLSYFTGQPRGLQPLDRAMLHAWYSPRVHGGMTPFEVLPVLADELVKILPNKPQAQLARDRFFARTIDEMQAFADGAGDVPTIVKRCGKATGAGIKFGRMEMSYFLGVAYQQGTTVARDPAQAERWLQRAASQGSRSAQARLSTVVGSKG